MYPADMSNDPVKFPIIGPPACKTPRDTRYFRPESCTR